MPFKDPEIRKKYNKKYRKMWYEKNKENRKKQIKSRKISIKDHLKKYKEENKCEVCLEDHYSALDFHHVGTKKYLVSKMANDGYSINSIMKEVEKCKLLCANCHRIEHYGNGSKKEKSSNNLSKK